MAFDPNFESKEKKVGPLTGNPIPAKDSDDVAQEILDAVRKPHETAKADNLRDHNHSMAQGDEHGIKSLSSGRQRTSAGVSMEAQSLQAMEIKKKDEKSRDRAMKQALEALNKRLAELRAEIAEIDEKLEKIDKQISAIDKAEQLRKEGKFDPENNPAHLLLLQKAGVTLDDYLQDPNILARRKKDLKADGKILRQRKGDIQKDVDHLENAKESGDPEKIKAALKETSNEALWQTEFSRRTQGEKGTSINLTESGDVLAANIKRGIDPEPAGKSATKEAGNFFAASAAKEILDDNEDSNMLTSKNEFNAGASPDKASISPTETLDSTISENTIKPG